MLFLKVNLDSNCFTHDDNIPLSAFLKLAFGGAGQANFRGGVFCLVSRWGRYATKRGRDETKAHLMITNDLWIARLLHAIAASGVRLTTNFAQLPRESQRGR